MALRELIKQVGETDYDHHGNRDQPTFQFLQAIADELAGMVPSHYLVRISEGVGNLPRGLWVSILDPDVTTTPTKGTYVVFLFNAARTHVTLSLNQGVTEATKRSSKLGMTAMELLRREAATARKLLEPTTDVDALETDVALGTGTLQRKYEAGNIYGRTWPLTMLPADDELRAQVDRFLSLYSDVVPLRESAVLSGTAELPPRDPDLAPKSREREFKPKSDADYRARITATEQTRSRSHEGLVARLGEWAQVRGFDPNTNVHPRDLVLHRDDAEDCLVEVKVFPPGRPKVALRECIGQLFEYRHFYHQDDKPDLVAALSEHPGAAFLDLFDTLNVAVVWPDGSDAWTGTRRAKDLGLA